MNELHDLMVDATQNPPDDGFLALDLVSVGRSRVRRRGGLLALGTAAAVAALAGGVSLLPNEGRSQATTPTTQPGRQVAVAEDQLALTLSRLLPGNSPVSELRNEQSTDGSVAGILTWRGGSVFIRLDESPAESPAPDPASPAPGSLPSTARQWCEQVSARCHGLPNGDWVSSGRASEPTNPSNWQARYVLYTADGFMVAAGVDNLAPRPGAATKPVLSVAALRRIAEDPVWLAH
jgi:hypothetical protein